MTNVSSHLNNNTRAGEVVLGAGVALCLVPIQTRFGSLYLAEIVMPLLAVHVWLRRGVLTPTAVSIGVLAGYVLALDLVGSNQDSELSLSMVRGLTVLLASIVIASNSSRERVEQVVLIAGLVLAGFVYFEAATNFKWIADSNLGYLPDKSIRLSGPLGPGPTGTALVTAFGLALHRHRSRMAFVLLVAVVLLAARTQLVLLVLVLGVFVVQRQGASRPMSRNYRVAVFAVSAALVVVVNILNAQLLDRVFRGFDQANDVRFELWRAGIDEIGWVGNGPGNVRYIPEFQDVPIFYAHSQYITLLHVVGLIALPFLGLIFYRFVVDSARHSFLVVSAPLLASALYGEFLIGATVRHSLGAVFIWLIISTPARAAKSTSGAPGVRARREPSRTGGFASRAPVPLEPVSAPGVAQ